METLPPTAHLTGSIASGDTGALSRFYAAWFDRTRALARSITRRDEAFCLDVVQEVMLRVADQMRPLACERAVRAWMGRTVMTTAIDLLRSERRRARREAKVARPEVVPDEPELVLAQAEETAWLAAQVALLTQDDRQLLQARFAQAGTLDEVGRRLGITGDAAHGRIRRLLGRLRTAARRAFE